MANILALLSPFWWPLSVSSLLNVAGLAGIVQLIRGRGGIRYLKSIVLHDNEATVDPGARARRQMHATMPTPTIRPIVFLGDSITFGCEWGEVFQTSVPVLNRGIGGDTSLGVLGRMADVCRLDPVMVFLMIGTNDPQMLAYTPGQTLQNCEKIIAQILESSPDAQVYVQSVLPSRSPKFNVWSGELNGLLQMLCNEQEIAYIDLRARFLDSREELDERLTYDGLHLSAEGFVVWREVVRPFVSQQLQARAKTAGSS